MTATTIDDIRTAPARNVPAAAILDAVATLYGAADHVRAFIGGHSALGDHLENAAERLVRAAYDERPDELFWEVFYAAGREGQRLLQLAVEASRGCRNVTRAAQATIRVRTTTGFAQAADVGSQS